MSRATQCEQVEQRSEFAVVVVDELVDEQGDTVCVCARAHGAAK